MRKNMWGKVAILLTVIMLAGCSEGGDAPAGTQDQTSGHTEGEMQNYVSGGNILNMGTGSVGGTDNTVLEAISSVVNSKTSLRTSTVTTSGGAEIIYLLEDGSVQGGYTGTIELVNALN